MIDISIDPQLWEIAWKVLAQGTPWAIAFVLLRWALKLHATLDQLRERQGRQLCDRDIRLLGIMVSKLNEMQGPFPIGRKSGYFAVIDRRELNHLYDLALQVKRGY